MFGYYECPLCGRTLPAANKEEADLFASMGCPRCWRPKVTPKEASDRGLLLDTILVYYVSSERIWEKEEAGSNPLRKASEKDRTLALLDAIFTSPTEEEEVEMKIRVFSDVIRAFYGDILSREERDSLEKRYREIVTAPLLPRSFTCPKCREAKEASCEADAEFYIKEGCEECISRRS